MNEMDGMRPGRSTRYSAPSARASDRIGRNIQAEYAWERQLASPIIELSPDRSLGDMLKKALSRFRPLFSRVISGVRLLSPLLRRMLRAVFLRRKQRRYQIGVGIAALFAVLVLGQTLLFHFGTNSNQGKSGSGTSGVQGAVTQKPDFDPVLPTGGNGTTDQKNVVFEPTRRVASYTDMIGTDPITISQQPMPENFKGAEAAELQKLATQIYANDAGSAGDINFYIGTSIKGPQTVIFVQDGLLIFIKSDKKIAKEDWQAYIAKLQ